MRMVSRCTVRPRFQGASIWHAADLDDGDSFDLYAHEGPCRGGDRVADGLLRVGEWPSGGACGVPGGSSFSVGVIVMVVVSLR